MMSTCFCALRSNNNKSFDADTSHRSTPTETAKGGCSTPPHLDLYR